MTSVGFNANGDALIRRPDPALRGPQLGLDVPIDHVPQLIADLHGLLERAHRRQPATTNEEAAAAVVDNLLANPRPVDLNQLIRDLVIIHPGPDRYDDEIRAIESLVLVRLGTWVQAAEGTFTPREWAEDGAAFLVKALYREAVRLPGIESSSRQQGDAATSWCDLETTDGAVFRLQVSQERTVAVRALVWTTSGATTDYIDFGTHDEAIRFAVEADFEFARLAGVELVNDDGSRSWLTEDEAWQRARQLPPRPAAPPRVPLYEISVLAPPESGLAPHVFTVASDLELATNLKMLGEDVPSDRIRVTPATRPPQR